MKCVIAVTYGNNKVPTSDPLTEEKLLDTNQIRKSYRRLIRMAILMASLVGLVYAPWCYFMGIALWWHSLVFSVVLAALYPLARDRTPFPLFLTCLFVFFAATVVFFGSFALRLGNAAGFQYLLFCILPVIIFSGRIGLALKWVFAVLLCAIFLWLDITSLRASLDGNSNTTFVTMLRGFNICVTFVALAYLIQSYFVDIAKIQQRLNSLAWVDPLTELLNRRRIVDLATVEYKISDRSGSPVSLILLDIDHFKAINDQFGHEQGDLVLQKASRIIKNLTRVSDNPCRWGGEEFLILLPHTDHRGALQLAERIRARFEQEAIPVAKTVARISMTLGVATRHAGELLESTVQRADTALYAGKAGGRNQVVSAA